MKALQLALTKQPLVYITRDLERALGLPVSTKNYFIITNATPFAKELASKHKNILLIKLAELLDTRELLTQVKTKKFLAKLKRPTIIVFKNTSVIERSCAEQGLTLLNPSANLASRVEEKISQVEWLGELSKFLPPHWVGTCKEIEWQRQDNLPYPTLPLKREEVIGSPLLKEWSGGGQFILQFNRAHTGSGTMLIESKKQLTKLQEKFPDRPVRVSEYISGPLFTNNNIVWDKNILVGNINYQITGLPPFTQRPFATIGNDWALPTQLLSAKQVKQFKQMARAIGKKLAKSGWKGLFGIDVALDQTSGKFYLIEINARQPASTTYESALQSSVLSPQSSVTTFEAHLAALLGLPHAGEALIQIKDGAQIIQKRIKNKGLGIKSIKKRLKQKGFEVIAYANTELESDWLRIQSESGIMRGHNEFNKIGKIIKTLLTKP